MLINDTSSYYKKEKISLFHEMTISQCLSSPNLPYFKLLSEKKIFGEIVAYFLKDFISNPDIIVEIGGGHGTLMKSFLKKATPKKIYMVDISQVFIDKQKQNLKNFTNIEFVSKDVFDFLKNFKEKIDILICNEVIGDLPTVVNINKKEFLEYYSLDVSYLPDPFNFNLGAIELIKNISGKVKVAFISEHSSTYSLPEKFKNFLSDERKNYNPREISLFGHKEYTINFKMLKEYAEQKNFKVIKKHFLEFLPLKFDKLVQFVLTSNSHQTEMHEIIYEFYNHVKEYELIVLYGG